MSDGDAGSVVPSPELEQLAKQVDAAREFLTGSAPFDGLWFGERHPTLRGMFWWRSFFVGPVLLQAAAALRTSTDTAQPVAGKDGQCGALSMTPTKQPEVWAIARLREALAKEPGGPEVTITKAVAAALLDLRATPPPAGEQRMSEINDGGIAISGAVPSGEVPELPNVTLNHLLAWLDNDGDERADDALIKFTTATGAALGHVTAGWMRRFITATNGTRFGECPVCGRNYGDHTQKQFDTCHPATPPRWPSRPDMKAIREWTARSRDVSLRYGDGVDE